jgi:hypothetical protein
MAAERTRTETVLQLLSDQCSGAVGEFRSNVEEEIGWLGFLGM